MPIELADGPARTENADLVDLAVNNSVHKIRPLRQTTAQPQAPSEVADGEARLNATMLRIMTAIAQREDMGHRTTDQSTAACLAGVRLTGTFTTYLSTMRTAGLLVGPASTLSITAAGRARLGDYQELPTGAELVDFFKRKHLNETQSKMFDAILAVYPECIDQASVAEAAGVKLTGTFTTYLSTMRRIGVIEGPASALRATDRLMGN